MSRFLCLPAVAAAQLSTSTPSPNLTLREPYNATSSRTLESPESENWLLVHRSNIVCPAAPSLYIMFLYFITLLLGCLIIGGLQTTAHPVRRHKHIHTQHAMQQEIVHDVIQSADPSQQGADWPSTMESDQAAATAQRPAVSGVHDGVAAQFDGSAVRSPQRSIPPYDKQGPNVPQTLLMRGPFGARVQSSREALQHQPDPTINSSAASQRSGKLKWSSLLVFAILFIVLSGLLGMADAYDPSSSLGDSTVSLIPVSNSTAISLAVATANSTNSSPTRKPETELAPIKATTSTNTTTSTAISRAAITAAKTLASISSSTLSNIPISSPPRPSRTSLPPSRNSSYKTVILTTVNGLLSVKAGASSTTTERYFVFSYTTVMTSNSTRDTSATKASITLARATSASASSSITSAVSTFPSFTAVSVESNPTLTGSTITSIRPTTTTSTKIGSSALLPFSTTTVNTSFGVPYVPGYAASSSFIPASATNSSATILPIPGNATLGLLSQTSTPIFPNGTTISVSTTIYTTVTSTRSVVVVSTVTQKASAPKFAPGTRSMSLATPLPSNTVATIINGTIDTVLPTTPQNSAAATTGLQTSFAVSLASLPNAATITPVVSQPTALETTTTTLLTTKMIIYSSFATSTAVGVSDLASPISVQTDSQTSGFVAANYFTSSMTASSPPMSPADLITSTAFAVPQIQVSPQYLVPNASLNGLSQRQISPWPSSHRQQSVTANPNVSAFSRTKSLPASTPAPTQPHSSGASAPTPAATMVPSTTITTARTGSLAPRADAISHGPSFATLSRQAAERAVTRASPLSQEVGIGLATIAQTQPQTTGVCPKGWSAISSGGEKRIKAWYAADVVMGYMFMGLVIGLGIIGGATARGLEDVREIL